MVYSIQYMCNIWYAEKRVGEAGLYFLSWMLSKPGYIYARTSTAIEKGVLQNRQAPLL